MINWPLESDDYYFCAPREKDEEGKFLYPGLNCVPNITDEGEVKNNRSAPCCFAVDQYIKSTGRWKKVLQNKENKDSTFDPCDESKKQPKIKTNIGRAVAQNKKAVQGGVAELPLYLSELDPESNIKRFGVKEGPNSFISCLEKVTEGNNKNLELKIRGELSSLEHFNYGKQELWDWSDSYIREYLKDYNKYFDPTRFISLMELRYGCKILLFQVSDDNIKGEVLLPEFSKVYLRRDLSESLPLFIIIVFISDEKNVIPQCEILFSESKKGNGEYSDRFNMSKYKLGQKALNIWEETLNVFIFKETLRNYQPISSDGLFQGLTAQFIDLYGKCQALVYDDFILFTSPLPPFNVPTVNMGILSHQGVSIDQAKKFCKSKRLKIQSQDLKQNDIKGLSNRLKRLKGLYLKSEDYSSIILYLKVNDIPIQSLEEKSFWNIDESSLLSQFNRNRKLANVLQQYTLFTYSSYDNISFTINPNHHIDIDKLNKKLTLDNPVIYEDKSIIVPSEDIQKRLEYFLKISLMNNKFLIKNYRNKKFIEGYYRFVSDFEKHSHEIIFSSVKTLKLWLEDRGGYHLITQQISRDSKIPFLYSGFKELGYVFIQNLQQFTELEVALKVASKWSEDKINLGFWSDEKSEIKNYHIYNLNGTVEKIGEDNNVYILDYSMGGGDYAAILPV